MNRTAGKKKFSKKIAAYSAAAAGVLALAPAAHAAVQYSGPRNLTVNPGGVVNVDINGDATNDFAVNADSGSSGSVCLSDLTSNAQHIDISANNDPANLGAGYAISNTLANPANHYWTHSTSDTLASVTGNTDGNFDKTTGFIGIRFNPGDCSPGSFHYGWIRFTGLTPNSGTIVDWAYDDACDTPILAGAGAVPVAATPVPTVTEWGAIGMAAALAGAAALRLRKGKKEA